MSKSSSKVKVVWGAVERRGKASWTQIGYAWTAAEGGLLAQLSAFPLSGRIWIQDGIEELVEKTAMIEEAVG